MKKALKTIFLFSILAITLSACSCTNSNQMKNPDECFSKGKSLKENKMIMARITGEDLFVDIEKESFTKEELEELRYGFKTQGIDRNYYIAYELCSSEGEVIEKAFIEEPAMYNKEEPNASTGTYSNFEYEVEGEKRIRPEEAGTYYVNVFGKEEDGNWEWVDQVEFEVTD